MESHSTSHPVLGKMRNQLGTICNKNSLELGLILHSLSKLEKKVVLCGYCKLKVCKRTKLVGKK